MENSKILQDLRGSRCNRELPDRLRTSWRWRSRGACKEYQKSNFTLAREAGTWRWRSRVLTDERGDRGIMRVQFYETSLRVSQTPSLAVGPSFTAICLTTKTKR